MTPSPRNAFICTFFLTYWNICILPGNAMLQLRSWFGCRVLIPCNGSGTDSDSFKWFYKKNDYSKDVQLYFQNKNGVKHYDTSRPKVDVMPNRSLVINNFTDKDRGIYRCENCHQDNCMSTPSSFITLQRESMDEIQETFYLLSDSSFTRECPSEFDNIKWTFEAAQRNLEQRSEMAPFSTNKTLYIGSVKNTNAGKYDCWVSGCGGQSQKLLTVNLCVITVHHQVRSNLSCAVTCNVGLSNLKKNSSLLKSNSTILVDIDSSGSLICNSSEILDERISTTSSYSASATLNTTMVESKKTDYFMIIIHGVLATFTLFILLAILSFCLKSRICPASRTLRKMEAPPVTVMPITSGTINMMEYLLQGSVLDSALESLLHRLRGLCDNMEPETFTDHELVYLLKGQQGNPFILRARRSLSHPTAPWHLRYLGQPEVGDKSRHALARNCVDVAASHSLPDFLNEMGFRMDHEFVTSGHIFRKGAMKVVVCNVSRVLVPGNTENTERMSLSHLVELSVLAPAGQDTVSEDMRSFAEQLKPLIHLEKIDPSKQRH